MLRKLRRKWHAKRVSRRLKGRGYEDIALLDAKLEAKETGYEVSATLKKHPAIAILADEIARFFDDEGGTNFVEMIFATNEGRVFTLTVAPRKPGALAPAEVVGRLKRAVELAHPWFEKKYSDYALGAIPHCERKDNIIAVRDALRHAMVLYKTP